MKTVVQRVARACVRVDGEIVGAIEHGALLLVGVERGDGLVDADATAQKIARLRFFPGATPMDRTLAEVGGGVLVVSQFTLAATLAKGNRPSFARAEDPSLAEGPLPSRRRAAPCARDRRSHGSVSCSDGGRVGERRTRHLPGVRSGWQGLRRRLSPTSAALRRTDGFALRRTL